MRKIALLAVVAFAAACGSSSSTPAGSLRVGNVSIGLAGASVAVDFCYAPSATPTVFSGPVMKGVSSTLGLPYSYVSRYFSLPADTYKIRVVPFAANSCATAAAGVADINVVVADGVAYTVLAAGIPASTPALQLKAFTDINSPDAAKVIIRFMNVLTDQTAFDIGTGTADAFNKIFDNLVWLGLPTATPPVDARGYASVNPSSFVYPVSLTTCFHGALPSALTCPSTVALSQSDVAGIKGGTIASAYLVPTLVGGGELVLCGDTTAPIDNYSACVVRQ
jgi:hypothetical protein